MLLTSLGYSVIKRFVYGILIVLSFATSKYMSEPVEETQLTFFGRSCKAGFTMVK
jgi:hypothetical protein